MRILLVEDRPDIREMLAAALRADGHHVEEAYDVTTAMAALMTPDSCDAVISDVGLPGGSGIDLADRAARAGIPALLCTGDPDAMMLLDGRRIRYLRKPFAATALLAWVDELANTRDRN